MKLVSGLLRISLLWKFAIVNLIPILLLGVVLQHYLHSRVQARAQSNATQTALAISRSEVERGLSARDLQQGLTKAEVRALDETLGRKDIREDVKNVTVWNRSLRIVYSRSRGRIGRRIFPLSNEHRSVLNGNVVSTRSGVNLEVYVPLWLGRGRQPEGAVQLSLPYAAIDAGVRGDTRKMSLLIFFGLAVLYSLLFRIVAGASRTLRDQAEVNEHQALHDALTDLPNRTLFHDRVGQALAVARREHIPVAVMIMDLDRFKEVNDTLGHASGDEFGVLLPKVVDSAAAAAVARKLRKALEEPFTIHGLALQIEASIGIALYPEHGDDVHSLLQRADVAMYVAKEQPGGCEIYAKERDEYSPDRLTMLTELRRAIDQGELVLHYQPKADLRSGEVNGVEALVRWSHPVRGLVPPDDFIPLAQKTGVIVPLTFFVLNEALRQCRTWQLEGLELCVGVNLSARNLLDVNLPDTVGELLGRWELPPSLLELEITESTILADPIRAMHVLSRISGMGVRLAIDDFGTGYSSLAYLKRLPVDELKIDKSFVQGMGDDENDAVIVRSTIDLGRNLGLRVVAEGVETAAAWRQLVSLGCDVAQGYYLSRPVSAAELAAWARARREGGQSARLRSA